MAKRTKKKSIFNFSDFRGGYATNTPYELMANNEMLQAEIEILLHCQSGKDPAALGHDREPTRDNLGRRQSADPLAVEPDAAFLQRKRSYDGVHGACLARRVAAKQADNLVVSQPDVQAVQHRHRPIGSRHAAKLEQGRPGAAVHLCLRAHQRLHSAAARRSDHPPGPWRHDQGRPR